MLAFAAFEDTGRQAPSDFFFGLEFHGGYQIRLNERVSLMRDRKTDWPALRLANKEEANSKRIVETAETAEMGKGGQGRAQMPDFLFQTAVFGTIGQVGGQGDGNSRKLRLERAEADLDGAARRPVRIRLAGRHSASGADGGVRQIATIEMSRGEAYAFSEWLDAEVTRGRALKRATPKPPAKRGSKDREIKR